MKSKSKSKRSKTVVSRVNSKQPKRGNVVAGCLWPDPFDAPDVPTERVLLQYLAKPASLPAYMQEQIAQSPDCQRALKIVKSRAAIKEEPISLEASMFLHLLPKKVKYIPSKSHASIGESREDKSAAGQIWRCSGIVEKLLDGMLKTRRTFLPVDLLLLSESHKTEWNDYVCDAVVCSPIELWPDVDDDAGDVVLRDKAGAEWVVHTNMTGQVSLDGLKRFLGYAADGCLKAVMEACRQKNSSSAPIFGVARKQLAARADWAFATARARKAHASSESGIVCLELSRSAKNWFLTNKKATEPVRAMAAATGSAEYKLTRLKVFVGEQTSKYPKDERGVFAAPIVPLHRMENQLDHIRGVWKIEESEPVFRKGSAVRLITRNTGDVLASGKVAKDGLTLEFYSKYNRPDAELLSQDWFIQGADHA